MAVQPVGRAGRIFPAAVARRRQWDTLPYALILPSLVLIALVELYPFALGFTYSLRDGTLLNAGAWVGIQNYVDLIALPQFQHALYFSAVFAAGNVVGSYVLGLALALLLNRRDIPARGFFRVAMLLPWIIPSIVSITSWRWLIGDQYGLVNGVLQAVGLGPIYFLSSDGWAMFSVTLIKIWRSFPFMMLSLLAALSSIDAALYEAARVDGAGRWQAFRFVTLPHLRIISVVLCILMTIYSVNDFDTPWLLTQGGPANATENLIVLAYKYTFTVSKVGMGSAISFFTLIVMMVCVMFLLREQKEEA
ncbi:MAG: sugar ABC transporter permease [Chloroflexota bacterium]|nr:sugar ABC transporter permease [Chloroflexota bacterium]